MSAENTSSILDPTGLDPDQPADYVIATVLLLGSIIGLPANILALAHFRNHARRNKQSAFFSRLYCLISSIDCLLCLLHLPVVHSLYTSDRLSSSLFFLNDAFCHMWAVLVMSLLNTAVFLVAALSIARLYVIMKQRTALMPLLSWLPTVLWLILILTVWTIPLLTKYLTVFYNPYKGVCVMYGRDENTTTDWTLFRDENNTIPREIVDHELIKKIVWTCLMAIPIPLIAASVSLSLYYLKRAGDRAKDAHGTSAAHKSASLTVVLVTLVYLLFNMPMFIYLITQLHYAQQFLAELKENQEDVSVKEYYQKLHSDYFARYYIWLLVFELPTVLRSAVNPVIFFWRIGSFRRFIQTRRLPSGESTAIAPTCSQTNQQQPPTRARKTSIVLKHPNCNNC